MPNHFDPDDTAIRGFLRDPVGPVARFITRLTQKAADVARGTVHVRTGETQRSIATDFRQGMTLDRVYEGEVSAQYAVFFLEKGTKPHVIASHGDYSLRADPTSRPDVRGRLGTEVLHPGQQPYPFLTTGLWSLSDDV